MIKAASLGLGMAALCAASAASAGDVRPAALNLQRTQPVAALAVPVPAKPTVRKRNNLAPAVIVGIVLVVGVGVGVAAASGGSSSPG